jgi:hypothetical protein
MTIGWIMLAVRRAMLATPAHAIEVKRRGFSMRGRRCLPGSTEAAREGWEVNGEDGGGGGQRHGGAVCR